MLPRYYYDIKTITRTIR